MNRRQRKRYAGWPAGSEWAEPAPKKVSLDARIAETASGRLRVLSAIRAGEEILLERPLFYSNFDKFEQRLPPRILKASTITHVAFDLLNRRIGGPRLLAYLDRCIGGRRGKRVCLTVTDRDREAMDFMRARFRGIREHTLIKLIKTIEMGATWNVSPVMRVVVGMGLYDVVGRGLEHSCEPNARLYVSPKDGEVRLAAVRDLRAGEPVTVSSDHDAKWRASRVARARILGAGRPGFRCLCSRCREGRDYDRKLLEIMASDQKEMPGYVGRGDLENVLDDMDRFLDVGRFGVFAMEEVWTHLKVNHAACPLIRIRFERSYINLVLQMTAEEQELMEAGAPPSPDGHHCSACDEIVGPEGMAESYRRSIAKLEGLGYLGRKRLEVDRLRLQLFRAFLAMRHIPTDRAPERMTWETVRFMMAYSAAMCTAEKLWGSPLPVVHEAGVWSKAMREILGLGAILECLISNGKI